MTYGHNILSVLSLCHVQIEQIGIVYVPVAQISLVLWGGDVYGQMKFMSS